jgi:predicted permease
MSWLKKLLFRVRADEMDKELRFHVDQQIDDNIKAGMTPKDARYAALRTFGGVEQIKEKCRDTQRTRFIEEFWQDLRYGLRMLRKSPVFTAAAVLSIALGIGANSAIFSLMDVLMFKMLPVREPQQLVELLTDRGGRPFNAFSFQALEYLQKHNRVFTGLVAGTYQRFYMMAEEGVPERVAGQYVTGNFFSVLGVGAVLGRAIAPEDDRFGDAHPVAVLSYRFWQRRFAGDSTVVGKSVIIEDLPFTIVGITPPEFLGVQVGRPVELWIPLSMEPRIRRPRSFTSSAGYKWLQLMGRLKPGVSIQQSRPELDILFKRSVIDEELALKDSDAHRGARNWKLVLEPGGSGLSQFRQQFSMPLQILLAVTVVVLLISCVNVANLLLARATWRQREIAVRLSMGAGRFRLIRQLCTESLLLAGLGGTLGIVLALWGSDYLLVFIATGRSSIQLEVGPDRRLLLFTTVVTVATGLLFGLLPALRAARTDLSSALKAASGAVQSQPAQRLLGKTLVVVQVALSIVLLVGAGLFLRTLHNLRSIDIGFDSEGVLLVSLDPARSRYTPEQKHSLFHGLIERFEGIPGVRAASICWITPITGGGTMRTVSIGGVAPAPVQAKSTYLNWIGPKYFATLGTPLLRGRDFGPQDTTNSPRVAIINQAMVRRYFDTMEPIGKTISMDGVSREIVGVVGDAKYLELKEATPPTCYLNTFQKESPDSELLVRTAGDPMRIAGSIRQEVATVAKGVLVSRVTTLERHVDASIVQERLLATLSGFFGALAALLAALGLYGVMAYSVARRTSEMGVRMALGAGRRDILWLVFRETLTLVLIGIALGLPAALAATRLISTQLFGVQPADPLALLAACALMLAVASLAGFLPARKASRVDPMIALRYE